MTNSLPRNPSAGSGQDWPPPHPHFTLGSIAVAALLTGLVAAAIGVGALFVTASRDSVDDRIVSSRVDEYLASNPTVPTTATPPTTAGPAAPTGIPLGASVTPELTPKAQLPIATEPNVSVAPAVPPAVTRTDQAIVEVHFEVVEQVATIDPATGVQYETWGYKISGTEGPVVGTPGPMVRARVGDVLRFTITNPATNKNPHNVDFHAVTGQGGGAADTTVVPGETAVIEARLLYPGMFLYHCASGDVPMHIIHGMYGGILVDPATPLPSAQREFYIVQSEYYTTGTDPGLVDTDRAAATDEHPTMVVFNGAKGAIAGDNTLRMNVGERARIYFVNAGLNLTSNFHPIGSHWDAVYEEGALLNPPIRGSQTTLVPAGGGTVVDLVGQVPQTVLLVDHALARTFDKGALGTIVIEGNPNPEIFEAIGTQTPVATAPPTTGVPDGELVTMVPGAWTTQAMDSPDEFAPDEDPADYSVNVLTITAGTTVSWRNDDPDMIHTVVAVDQSFDSGFMLTGDVWSYTFDTPGEYEYYCLPHPWMRAKIIVQP